MSEELPPDHAAKMAALLDQYEALFKENASLKAEIAHKRILDELTEAARILKIPESVAKFDLPKYADDFTISDGKVVLRLDPAQDAIAVLTALQKERPHWLPKSVGSGNEPMKATSHADNYSAFIEQQTKNWFD